MKTLHKILFIVNSVLLIAAIVLQIISSSYAWPILDARMSMYYLWMLVYIMAITSTWIILTNVIYKNNDKELLTFNMHFVPIGFGAVSTINIAVIAIATKLGKISSPQGSTSELYVDGASKYPVMVILCSSVLAPIAETLIFGVALPAIIEKLWKKKSTIRDIVEIVVPSLLFALMHPTSTTRIIAFFANMVFVMIFFETASAITPITIHAINNVILILMQIISPENSLMIYIFVGLMALFFGISIRISDLKKLYMHK